MGSNDREFIVTYEILRIVGGNETKTYNISTVHNINNASTTYAKSHNVNDTKRVTNKNFVRKSRDRETISILDGSDNTQKVFDKISSKVTEDATNPENPNNFSQDNLEITGTQQQTGGQGTYSASGTHTQEITVGNSNAFETLGRRTIAIPYSPLTVGYPKYEFIKSKIIEEEVNRDSQFVITGKEIVVLFIYEM